MFKTQMEEYMKSKNIIQDEESSYESEYILRCCPGKGFFSEKSLMSVTFLVVWGILEIIKKKLAL